MRKCDSGRCEMLRGTGKIENLQRITHGVTSSGEPRSIRLRPGLLGKIYDGLLRPLAEMPSRCSLALANAALISRALLSPRVPCSM